MTAPPPDRVFLVFENGLFLGYFTDLAKASSLVSARAGRGEHEIVPYYRMAEAVGRADLVDRSRDRAPNPIPIWIFWAWVGFFFVFGFCRLLEGVL